MVIFTNKKKYVLEWNVQKDEGKKKQGEEFGITCWSKY